MYKLNEETKGKFELFIQKFNNVENLFLITEKFDEIENFITELENMVEIEEVEKFIDHYNEIDKKSKKQNKNIKKTMQELKK